MLRSYLTRGLIAGVIALSTLYTTANTVTANPVTHSTMLAVAGQTGDMSFDTAWLKVHNDCSILAVIDNADDTTSPYIYTRLSCQLTQDQVDNMPELLGDSLLSLTPLYTTYIPVISK